MQLGVNLWYAWFDLSDCETRNMLEIELEIVCRVGPGSLRLIYRFYRRRPVNVQRDVPLSVSVSVSIFLSVCISVFLCAASLWAGADVGIGCLALMQRSRDPESRWPISKGSLALWTRGVPLAATLRVTNTRETKPASRWVTARLICG